MSIGKKQSLSKPMNVHISFLYVGKRCVFIFFEKEEGIHLKRLYGLLVTLLLFMGLIAACGNDEGANEANDEKGQVEEKVTEESSFPVTLKDAKDEEVVIEQKPEKIVSLIPSNTEIIYAIGAGDALVGVSEQDNYPEEALEIEQVARNGIKC